MGWLSSAVRPPIAQKPRQQGAPLARSLAGKGAPLPSSLASKAPHCPEVSPVGRPIAREASSVSAPLPTSLPSAQPQDTVVGLTRPGHPNTKPWASSTGVLLTPSLMAGLLALPAVGPHGPHPHATQGHGQSQMLCNCDNQGLHKDSPS
jgi:hypothetical protein